MYAKIKHPLSLVTLTLLLACGAELKQNADGAAPDDGGASAGGTASPGAGASASGGAAVAGNGGSTAASGGSTAASSGGSSGAGGAPGEPEPPGIQYFGRWDFSDAAHPSASWGAVYLKAKFEGTSLGILLEDAQNTFDYRIDGGPLTRLGPTAATEHALASGLPDGVHTLELYRRSEGGYGKTVVSGLLLDPGKNVLAPDPRPARRVEIVGDSISAGFGNEGNGGSTPATQNGYEAYGPKLARLLGAEWSVIAHSGQGMYRNLCEALPPSAQHMPDEFKLMHHPGVGGTEWDFSRWQPDVLVVTLGTNDYADYPAGSCAGPDAGAFKAAYVGFLDFARSQYPSAEIFAVGTFIATASNQFGTCNQTVCAAVSETADPKIHCVEPSLGAEGSWLVGPGDYIGDWTHPTIAGHDKLAERLRAVIAPVLGW
jgi:lysophospholipase L1-like esterase